MQKTLGALIADSRRAQGMTQLELAEKMGVMDKAVSKWERNLSCPDISPLPKLAGILELSVEDLIQGEQKESPPKSRASEFISLALKSVALAMGIAVTILTLFDKVDSKSALTLLGIGLSCAALFLLRGKVQ